MSNDNIWIASFDIGKCNFSFYIEEMSLKELEIIKNISKDKRYNQNGTCTLDFSNIIKKVYLNGKIILLENVDLTKDTNKSKYFDLEWCHNMIDILDKYKEYWDKVSYFVIEQQMSFGKKNNTMALKLGQNCESYFMFKYGRFKKVIEFPAYYKTQILGAQKGEKILKSGKIKYVAIDKPARKKWSIKKGLSILEERKDFDTIEELQRKNGRKKQKLDDKMDVLCQLQSFKYLYFVEKMKLF
jgi:hypothetical protein